MQSPFMDDLIRSRIEKMHKEAEQARLIQQARAAEARSASRDGSDGLSASKSSASEGAGAGWNRLRKLRRGDAESW